MKTCTIRHLRENWKSRQDEMNERIVDDNDEGSNHPLHRNAFLLPSSDVRSFVFFLLISYFNLL
jgi:hypothetical protein